MESGSNLHAIFSFKLNLVEYRLANDFLFFCVGVVMVYSFTCIISCSEMFQHQT